MQNRGLYRQKQQTGHSRGNMDVDIPWDDWEVVQRIGKSRNGTVYEIKRDNQSGKPELDTMKVVSIPQNKDEIESIQMEGGDEQSVRKHYEEELKNVLNEYAILSKHKGHSNIVSVEERTVVEHEGGLGWNLYIRMEHLRPLTEIVAKKKLSEKEIIKLGMDICVALKVCHKEGIIHRNIEPESVMLSDTDNYKLSDFGIAKYIDHTIYVTTIGTPNFMSPEAIKNKKYGQKADIYSLGMVLYWLLNDKKHPFLRTKGKPTGNEMADAEEKRIYGKAQIPEPVRGSKQLQSIVLKALEYKPNNRFENVSEMYDALKAVKAESAGPEEAEKFDNEIITADWIENDTIYGTKKEGLHKIDMNKTIRGKSARTSKR